MKHTLRAFFALMLALCLCLSFAGCGGGGNGGNGGGGTTPSGHTHTFAAEWSHDEEKHWHAATCDHTSERSGEAAHNFQNGKCTECKYEHAAHVFGAYEKTETEHTQTCSVCGKTVSSAHTYENGKCTACEYEHGEHVFGAYEKTETEHSQTCSDCGKTVSSAHTYENGECKICEYRHKDHIFDEYTMTETEHAQTCSVCGKGISEEHTYENGKCKICDYAHQNHTYGSDNTCKVCGAGLYIKSEDGKKIYFGSYPQTEVKDDATKNALMLQAGELPSEENKQTWTDYGYYYGTLSAGSQAVHSYMWYQDVSYRGQKYRGVYFISYRPYSMWEPPTAGSSYQDDNGYEINTVYWFKYEPIEWRVLENKNDTAFLMANIILDSQQFDHNTSSRMIDGETVYQNNYKESDIRAWLTGTFYETAFDAYAKQIIETTLVDNSALIGLSANRFACEDTRDKVFLLSYEEIHNKAYGFNSDASDDDPARHMKSTDYAKSQGVYTNGRGPFEDSSGPYAGNGQWWLRTPNSSAQGGAYSVFYDGDASIPGTVWCTNYGIVPALWIKL